MIPRPACGSLAFWQHLSSFWIWSALAGNAPYWSCRNLLQVIHWRIRILCEYLGQSGKLLTNLVSSSGESHILCWPNNRTSVSKSKAVRPQLELIHQFFYSQYKATIQEAHLSNIRGYQVTWRHMWKRWTRNTSLPKMGIKIALEEQRYICWAFLIRPDQQNIYYKTKITL